MNWNSNGTSHAYTFTYDGVNRMLNATHGTGAYTEKVTSYDKNGNIKALQRYGNGLIDNLTYTYSGNQLTRVDDATGNVVGFSNGASAANEYVYDNNGNLTKDSNKGITNIAYNSLNLPSKVTFSDGSTIVYSYSADGTKLRTVHVINGTSTQKDYCANVVYEDSIQKLLLTEEGYVDLSVTSPAYYYYLKDHQGNNRVVVSSGGTVAEVNHYYPFGGVFASTGNVQPYKYNGKELDTKKGLNWYDYGARHYDSTLGRWFVVDPLAEKMYNWSPYNFCKNNPVNRVDFKGKDDYAINKNGWISLLQKTESNHDRVYYQNVEGKSVTINDKSFIPQLVKSQKDYKGYRSAFGKTANLQDAVSLFKLGADNSEVEWKLDVYNNDGNITAIVVTDHNPVSVEDGSWAKKETKTQGLKLIDIHSHPSNESKGASDKDRSNINSKKNAVYLKQNKTLHEYNKNVNSLSVEKMETTSDLYNYILKFLGQ